MVCSSNVPWQRANTFCWPVRWIKGRGLIFPVTQPTTMGWVAEARRQDQRRDMNKRYTHLLLVGIRSLRPQ